MTHTEGTTAKQASLNLPKNFKEQALQIINASLEETLTQHPIDVPQVFEYDRPTLGGSVPISMFRAVRLLALREVLGSKVSAAILNVSGRSVARKMGVKHIADLVGMLEDFTIGRLQIEQQTDDGVHLLAIECATCSGLPDVGEALCHFEAGFISGGLENDLGEAPLVVETQCWGLGNRVCRWEASRRPKSPAADDGGSIDPLELVMTLAGKAASAVDNAIMIRQKNRQLREAYHQLREFERLKKDLTDMIVHDMRVPLTAVLGSMQTLAEMTDSRLSSQETELLNMAISSGQTLLHMVNDLLDISKLEEHKTVLRKHHAPVSHLVDQAIRQVDILVRRKKLKLEVEVAPDLPEVPVDQDRIVRVLVNLLGNAIRHTPSGGRISIGACCEPDGKMVRISVSDTGEGIPKEYHTKIFDKFVQMESHRSRKRLSTGLGLTFCKLVTEAHGGSIRVESEPEVGSTFIFTLPV